MLQNHCTFIDKLGSFRYHKYIRIRRDNRLKGLKLKGERKRMRRMDQTRGKLFLLVLCVCFCLLLCTAALASGVERDEDGGVWDYDKGTYTDPTGKVHEITPGGVQEDNPGPGTVSNQDGSMTVVTQEKDPVANPNGGMEVESGQIQSGEPEATRAPLTGEEWEALLAGVAAKNGTETPTVWTDPSTGETHSVQVKYMGVGRSMVVLNGQNMLANTVDLKWETTAPEDKVLAAVSAPKLGYAWLRKDASSSMKNPKIQQIRTDTVLRVIGTGKNWTLVDCGGLRGYVLTSALEFFRNDHTDFEPGVISVKGRTKGNDTVHARSRDRGRRDLGEYKLGTPITVFDIIDEWAEVDICGWHGMILSKYVTVVEE